jgi:hypothetical protein
MPKRSIRRNRSSGFFVTYRGADTAVTRPTDQAYPFRERSLLFSIASDGTAVGALSSDIKSGTTPVPAFQISPPTSWPPRLLTQAKMWSRYRLHGITACMTVAAGAGSANFVIGFSADGVNPVTAPSVDDILSLPSSMLCSSTIDKRQVLPHQPTNHKEWMYTVGSAGGTAESRLTCNVVLYAIWIGTPPAAGVFGYVEIDLAGVFKNPINNQGVSMEPVRCLGTKTEEFEEKSYLQIDAKYADNVSVSAQREPVPLPTATPRLLASLALKPVGPDARNGVIPILRR